MQILKNILITCGALLSSRLASLLASTYRRTSRKAKWALGGRITPPLAANRPGGVKVKRCFQYHSRWLYNSPISKSYNCYRQTLKGALCDGHYA
jgi:hypothetical protein